MECERNEINRETAARRFVSTPLPEPSCYTCEFRQSCAETLPIAASHRKRDSAESEEALLFGGPQKHRGIFIAARGVRHSNVISLVRAKVSARRDTLACIHHKVIA